MKTIRQRITVWLVLAVALLLVPAARADAADVSQTGATQSTITISWSSQDSSTGNYTVLNYKVYVGDDSSSATLYQTLSSSSTSITITDLSAGCKKYVKVTYDRQSSYSTSAYTYTLGTVYDARTLPGKVTGLKQKQWWYFALDFDAQWDRQAGADGYEWIVYKSNGKKFASGKTTNTYSDKSVPTFRVTNISNSMVYSGKVRAYVTINGETYYGAWSDTAYFLTQPRITSAKVSSSRLTVKWQKVSGATGYAVYVSTKKTSGYKKVATVSASKKSVTIKTLNGKKFSSKKTYYVYVVTRKKVNSKTYTSGKLYYWNTKTTGFGYF